MTGYHITIGYLSDGDKEAAWEELKRVALDLCERPELIAIEAIEYGMKRGTALEYAQSYKTRTDSTIRFKEADGEDQPPQIMQLASGGGESRKIKEAMRRAFCRLIMRRMHRLGIEININVA